MNIAMLMLMLLGPVAGAAQADAGGDGPEWRERYGLLLERNIFIRDRRPPRVERTPQAPSPPPPIESRFVLTGIVEEGDAYRAHIEDRSTSTLLRLGPGDAVARGRVVQIDLDAVVYEAEGVRTRVPIGSDFLGQTPSGSAQAGGGDGDQAAPPDATAAAADEAGLSLEERMRRRRAQEIGQR